MVARPLHNLLYIRSVYPLQTEYSPFTPRISIGCVSTSNHSFGPLFTALHLDLSAVLGFTANTYSFAAEAATPPRTLYNIAVDCRRWHLNGLFPRKCFAREGEGITSEIYTPVAMPCRFTAAAALPAISSSCVRRSSRRRMICVSGLGSPHHHHLFHQLGRRSCRHMVAAEGAWLFSILFS